MKNIFLTVIFIFSCITDSVADDNKILIQSTTSTRDSGFYEYILPYFYKSHDITVSVVSVGTGQAIKNASRCDGDLLIVHSPALEKKFMASGYGLLRNNLMYNNFIIIGPENDPIKINSSSSILNVFSKIYSSKYKFISRGDDSGTHSREKDIWKLLDLDTSNFSNDWYLESGQGMGATVNIAIGLDAYTLVDQATWLRFTNKSNHTSLFERDDNNLLNQYGIITINPAKCPNLNHNSAKIFYDWILSAKAQALIDRFMIDGARVFRSNID
jgi:tungstate transport system substrate-binding protein